MKKNPNISFSVNYVKNHSPRHYSDSYYFHKNSRDEFRSQDSRMETTLEKHN